MNLSYLWRTCNSSHLVAVVVVIIIIISCSSSSSRLLHVCGYASLVGRCGLMMMRRKEIRWVQYVLLRSIILRLSLSSSTPKNVNVANAGVQHVYVYIVISNASSRVSQKRGWQRLQDRQQHSDVYCMIVVLFIMFQRCVVTECGSLEQNVVRHICSQKYCFLLIKRRSTSTNCQRELSHYS
jgi:hypothetical protein